MKEHNIFKLRGFYVSHYISRFTSPINLCDDHTLKLEV